MNVIDLRIKKIDILIKILLIKYNISCNRIYFSDGDITVAQETVHESFGNSLITSELKNGRLGEASGVVTAKGDLIF